MATDAAPQKPIWTSSALNHPLFSIDQENSTQAPDALTAATLIYIGLPNLIFLCGWLRLPYAVAAALLVSASLWQFMRNPHLRWRQPYTTGALLFIIATAFAWSSLGGAGHFFHVNRDWQVRDTVLGDLTFAAWPPSYGITDGQHHILRSAIGFFLPAALLGKLAGIAILDIALYLWTALGASLFFLLLPLQRAGRTLPLLLLVTIFFSGMDFIGIVLMTGAAPIFPLNLEWWVPFSYTSITGQIHWAPNHCLALWLTATLFYRHWGNPAFPAVAVVLLPLSVIWTPFAALGILPFMALGAIRWFLQGNRLTDSGLTVMQIVVAVLMSYLAVSVMTLGLSKVTSSAALTSDLISTDSFALKYLVFILLEFGALALLVGRHLSHSQGLLWLCALFLAVLPLYCLGPSNDAMLRLSTPSLVIILILTLGLIRAWVASDNIKSIPPSAWAVGVVLIVGACTPLNEMWRAFSFPRTPSDYSRSLPEQQKSLEPPHYIGALDRPDLQILLRTPAVVPTAEKRIAQGLLAPVSSPK